MGKVLQGLIFFGFPPYPFVDDTTRPYIYAVFLILTIVMVPIWWWTTSVPRSSLSFPPHRIFPLRHTRLSKAKVILVALQEDEWNDLDRMRISPLVETTVDEDVEFEEQVDIEFIHKDTLPNGDDIEEIIEQLHEGKDNLDEHGLYHLYIIKTPSLNQKTSQIWQHPSKRVLFCSNAALHPHFESPQRFLETLFSEYFKGGQLKDRNAIIPDSPQYQLTFTLVIGQSDNSIPSPLTWEIQEAIKEFILPLVNRLRQFTDIKLHFQIRPFAEMSYEPDFVDGTFILNDDQLPVLVNDNLWNIASSTSRFSSINFLVLVPPTSIQPLFIQDTTEAADERISYFGYRQWGGVYILNHSKGQVIKKQSLKLALASFAGELRRMFGLDFQEDELVSFSWVLPSSDNFGITVGEEDFLFSRLFRLRSLSTTKTLQALQRLLTQNSEIVVLPVVGSLVNEAVKSFKDAEGFLTLGRWQSAFLSITNAAQLSDAAFFHPTMMAHQYFPNEHKLGVYLPLFFPFILPILIATLHGVVGLVKSKLSVAKQKAL